MKKPLKISEMTSRELLEYYESNLIANIRRRGGFEILSPSRQGKSRHDMWSIYAYGNEIKVVYIKTAPKIKSPQNEKTKSAEGGRRGGAVLEKAEAPRTTDERFYQSLSRSRSRIFELAMCNEFQYFCTFTQDKEKRERFNLSEFRKDFSQMVRNLNKTRPENEKIRYLLIPEQHLNSKKIEDRGAWHMHGLLMGLTSADLREFTLSEKLPENIRKSINFGKKVYNWEKYSRKFGYFTCTEIENKTACSKYITKYLTKDLKQTARRNGEHLFFASQGLKGRETVLKECLDICPFTEWDFENDYVKVKWLTVPKTRQ